MIVTSYQILMYPQTLIGRINKKEIYMRLLNRLTIPIFNYFSKNKFAQIFLEKNVRLSQRFMGIGSGGGVFSSGEQVIFDILAKKYAPPYCIFDVGANKGQFLSLALKKISTNKFSIHCFEPGKETFKHLCESGKDDRVLLNNIGIGDKKEEKTHYYDKIGSGLASLTKRRLDHFGIAFNESETVQIETIDNYCKEKNINRIHLLKIDIEGHELDAFAGAKEMFANNAIDIITFEFGGCNIDTRTFFQDFWYFFLGMDMELFRITPSGYLFSIEAYKEIDEQYRTTNFIAMKKG